MPWTIAPAVPQCTYKYGSLSTGSCEHVSRSSFLPAPCYAPSRRPGPTLTVNAAANRHATNPDIYGIVNYGLDPNFAEEIKLPNTRCGGSGNSNPTPGGGPDTMIRTFQSAGTHPLLTIPIIPYINSTAAWTCSFPVSIYGPQQSTNPYVHPNGDNCGNSFDPVRDPERALCQNRPNR